MQHINKFEKGIVRGINKLLMPQDTYTYLLNGTIISKEDKVYIVSNIKGTKPVAKFLSNEVPIGTCYYNNILYIITYCTKEEDTIRLYSMRGSDGEKWIDEDANDISNNLRLVPNMRINNEIRGFEIKASVFNITKDKLLEIIAKEDYDGSVNLYICNGLIQNIIINTGLDRNGKCTNRYYNENCTIQDFAQQMVINKIPVITTKIGNNGLMKPGAYWVYIRYEDQSLNATPFIVEHGPIYIHANKRGYINDDSKLLSKNIILNITNIDTKYKYIGIGIIYMYGENGLLSRDMYMLDKRYEIINDNMIISFDNNVQKRTFLYEELLNDNIKQNKCETHTQIDGIYFGANWKTDNINEDYLKKVASLIIPTVELKNHNISERVDQDNPDTEFMEEEIYPLGVSFLVNGHYKTKVYPIFGWFPGYSKNNNKVYCTIISHKRYTLAISIKINKINVAENISYFIKSINGNVLDTLIRISSINHIDDYYSLDIYNNNIPGGIDFNDGDILEIVDDNVYILGTPLNTNQNEVNLLSVLSPTLLENIDNKKGLFMFPKKKYIENTNESHFKLMGLKLNYELAIEYINTYTGEKPEITGIYICCGERIKNVITQGFSVAAVEAVGFYFTGQDNDNKQRYIEQTTNIGTSNIPVAFPWIDGSNYRLFPIIKLEYLPIDNNTDKLYWKIIPESISQLFVVSKGETYFTYPPVPESYTWNANQDYSYEEIIYNQSINYYRVKNAETDKFCIYTPDIINNNIQLKDTVYIKPIYRINIINSMYSGYGAYNSYYGQISNTRYGDFIKSRFIHPTSNEYIEISNNEYFNTQSTKIIDENIVYDTDLGFSSKMNSIFDVFGDGMLSKKDEQDLPSAIMYINASRNELFNAGVLINRSRANNNDDIKDEISRPKVLKTVNDYLYPFVNKRINPYDLDDHTAVKKLPVIAISPSISSLPYIGIKLPENGTYLTTATSNIVDYRNLHNCIVNVCNYNNIEEYIQDAIKYINKYNITYYILDTQNIDIINPIYKGDIFSQETTMRCLRYKTIPEDMFGEYDNEYAWKNGRAIQLYLQSQINTNLRVKQNDNVLYNLIEDIKDEESDAWKYSEKKNEFTYKINTEEYKKESWVYNDAYNIRRGMLPIDFQNELFQSIISNNSTRIRYSTKSISGAFVDAYKNLPDDQYRDIGSEYGEIKKLIEYNSTLFSIQESAITQYYQNSKIETLGDTSEIILGNKDILSEETRIIATYGTQHKNSIVVGDKGVYGIDWNRNKIWRITGSPTQTGKLYYNVEELTMTKYLFDFFTLIKNGNEKLGERIYIDKPENIISVYDEDNNQIIFTIKNKDRYISICYSELYDKFINFLSYNNDMYMRLNNRLFSFNKEAKSANYLWEHNVGQYNYIYEKIEPFVLEFIINGLSENNNASNFEKEFHSHIINMCPEEIDKMEWETDYQYSDKYPFIDKDEFWTNPEYKEGTWEIPIIPNKKTTNDGPINNKEFYTFEENSKMRGKWLLVRLRYIGTKPFYIYNVVTNFIISFK